MKTIKSGAVKTSMGAGPKRPEGPARGPGAAGMRKAGMDYGPGNKGSVGVRKGGY